MQHPVLDLDAERWSSSSGIDLSLDCFTHQYFSLLWFSGVDCTQSLRDQRPRGGVIRNERSNLVL